MQSTWSYGSSSFLTKRRLELEIEEEEGPRKMARLEPLTEGSVAASIRTGSSGTRRKNARRAYKKSRAHAEMVEELQSKFQFIRVADEGRAFRKIREGQTFGDEDPVWREFVDSHPGVVPEWFSAKNYTMFKSSDQAQMNHLKHFDRDMWMEPHEHKESYDLAVEAVRLLLEPEDLLEFPHSSDLEDVPFKKHKYCGYDYRKDGYVNRGDAHPAALQDAKRAWSSLLSGEHVEPHYVRLGGRGKVKGGEKEYHENVGTVAGRLILMLSQRDFLLLGNTEKPATGICKRPECPIFVGKSWYFGGATKFVNDLAGYQKFYCLDAHKYDSSLDAYLIRMAIKIIRSWFVNGLEEEYDVYWEFVIESLVTAPIMRDDGVAFRKFVGTTSGHSHNTLVQSIITLVLGYAAIFQLNTELDVATIFDNMVVYSLGDDNLIATRHPIKESTVEDVALVVKQMCNVDWSGDKSFATTRLADPLDNEEDNDLGGEFQGVQFLGKYFKMEEEEYEGKRFLVAIPYRPAWETLFHLSTPEREPSTIAQQRFDIYQLFYMRAVGLYLDGAGNHISRAVLDAVLDWLEGMGKDAYLTDDAGYGSFDGEDISKKVFGYISEEGGEGCVVRRFDYEEWRDMVLLEKITQLPKLRPPWLL